MCYYPIKVEYLSAQLEHCRSLYENPNVTQENRRWASDEMANLYPIMNDLCCQLLLG
jgi:hypothetical protein